jgi:hypothetical protein
MKYNDFNDNYDIINYFKLEYPVNEIKFKHILTKFTNKKNNNLIKKLLLIFYEIDFIEYKNILLQYFSFYKDINILKKIFSSKIKMYQYRFSSLIYKHNPEIFYLLLDHFTINQLCFYSNIDKEYDNNYISLINKIYDNLHADILIKIIEKNLDTITNLNFNILYLISKSDNYGNIFFKILQIYKTHSINIKEPSILLINSLEKYSLFTFDEHANNVIFFHNNFDKKKLNLDIIKKNYNELFLEYIKITSKYKSI